MAKISLIEDGQRVGSVECWRSSAGDDLFEIGEVEVADGKTGRGIGSRLIKKAEDWAAGKGAKAVILCTDIPGFYERLGYRVILENVGLMGREL